MFYKSYCLLQPQLEFFDVLNSYINLSYYDDILLLKNPKLLSIIGSRSLLSKSNINTSLKESVSSVTNSSSKFERKHKVSSYEQDSMKPKKSKVKLMKSKRKTSDDIEDVKLFVNRSDDVFSQDLLNRSNKKLPKVNAKNKKKYKLKVDASQSDNRLQDFSQSKQDVNFTQSDKSIVLNKPLSLQDLSLQLCVHEADIITYLFLNKNISATMNQVLDVSIVRCIAEHYGFSLIELSSVQKVDNHQQQYISRSSITIKRSPIITILGHVDHGKTTLLDAILKTNLVSKEYGGITQAISGYEVVWNYNLQQMKLIFLDTPGHESFSQMRLRGAKVTDIVLLVIALDDGLKPQTIEAINYIKDMNLSCIVVITKSDKLLNNISKIKQDLANYNILCEEWGGEVPFVEVSAINGKNINLLLSRICTLSTTQNFFANPQDLATGTILESYLDKKQGSIANVLIQNGTLKLGDIIASGNLYGKVKSINNMSNIKIKFSGPSSIVQVLGFTNMPQAGLSFCVFHDEKSAKEYCGRHSNVKQLDIALKSLNTRITLDASLDIKQVKLILKANTQGSLEAILDLLSNISQSKVQINIISASFGSISNTDVELAVATGSFILAFNVNILSQINSLLKKYKINFKLFYVIYDLFEYVKSMMLSLIEPAYDKVLVGNAVVQTVFNMNKGYVAGCIVNEGKINKKSYIHVYRHKSIVYEGLILSLKRIKSDVEEVVAINECGLMSDFDSWQDLDVIQAYELVAKEKTL
uniref:Translation initiation factor IF-2, chloroplastic n=1 Tax=Symphyocladiella dendroidea TaxID=2506487 RepID=A0A1Z1M784_9FLOR|nr:translation initiation factor 2 [Symphyocladiella dendroidea]ARW61876.1 translation initiation factor 2 [Symphyocladiella dendroidea]